MAHLDRVGDGLEEFDELGATVVGDAALAPEVVVVRRDELGKVQLALRRVLQQLHHLATGNQCKETKG